MSQTTRRELIVILAAVAVIAVVALLFLGTMQGPTVLSTVSGGGGLMTSQP